MLSDYMSKKKINYLIPESSAFFQGHRNQFFSLKRKSFQITSNYPDFTTRNINIAKYKKVFLKSINNLIRLRKGDGGDYNLLNENQLIINKVRLVDSKNEDVSGSFTLYPKSALCKKNNCNTYFDIRESRPCGHKDSDPWEQLTIAAFCDDCGRLLPLHYMTNLNHNCEECNSEKSMAKLYWRSFDQPSSFKVICIKCGALKPLFFFHCDHYERKIDFHRSSLEKKKFRGVPVRANAIYHPFVITIPDIPSIEDGNQTTKLDSVARVFSEAFSDIVSNEIEEVVIYSNEFLTEMRNSKDFWELPRIKLTCEDLDIEQQKLVDLRDNEIIKVIRNVLRTSFDKIRSGADEDKLKKRYGIDIISKLVSTLKELEYTEKDYQGMLLINTAFSQVSSNVNIPSHQSYLSKYKNKGMNILNQLNIYDVYHISNLKMIQAELGYIEGSTRRKPLLFDTFRDFESRDKHTVYVRDFLTEGIVFQLNKSKIFQWIKKNNPSICSTFDIDENKTGNASFAKIIKNEECVKQIEILLHTFSHLLIQKSTEHTGLDVNSISEIIYPKSASFLLYSTNSINIGGLEFTFDEALMDWLSEIQELAKSCPQDPACLLNEKGSCNACCYVPEFVCERFNNDLDRSSITGKTERIDVGFLDV